MSEKWESYAVEYNLDGHQWTIEVKATSKFDAKRRIQRAASFGRVTGPWTEMPIATGWWVPIWCWWQNRRGS